MNSCWILLLLILCGCRNHSCGNWCDQRDCDNDDRDDRRRRERERKIDVDCDCECTVNTNRMDVPNFFNERRDRDNFPSYNGNETCGCDERPVS